MEDQLTRLIDKVWDRYLKTPTDQRLLIAISGIPGSGKTTLSLALVCALNSRAAALLSSRDGPREDPSSLDRSPAAAAYIPMDGYHHPRSHLSSLPDPLAARARRGAEFTFDGASFLSLVRSLRQPLSLATTATIRAPSFDHAVKDPVPDAIPVHPWHRLVVVEGLYVLLDREPWRSAAALMDEKWFVRVDFQVARRRLVRRHVAAGIAKDEEEADRRAVENDLVNGEEIVRDLLEVDEVVVSREDEKWVHG